MHIYIIYGSEPDYEVGWGEHEITKFTLIA